MLPPPLRFLTVSNTGGGTLDCYAAIYNSGTSPRLTHVTASTSGGGNYFTVYNDDGSNPTMTNATVTSSVNAVYNANGSRPSRRAR